MIFDIENKNNHCFIDPQGGGYPQSYQQPPSAYPGYPPQNGGAGGFAPPPSEYTVSIK